MTAVGTATNPVQKALVAKLSADAQFMELVQGLGIFDQAAVPVAQPLPYVTIGEPIELPMECMGTVNARGYDDTFTFHIWSQARGFKVVQSILARLNVLLLDRQKLTLPGQWHVGTRRVASNSLEDPDGITQHVVVRYSIQVQEDL